MILEVNEDRIEETCFYAYNLNKEKKSQCRPFKNDIVLSEIREKFSNLAFHEDDKLLICVDEQENILGVLGLFTELSIDYLQAFCGIYAHDNYQEVGNEFIEYLEKEYKGLNMMFAYPKENIQGIALMGTHEFVNIEDAVIYELTNIIEDNLSNKFVFDNELVNKEKTILFYEENQEDVFWTINKMINDKPNWIIMHYIEEDNIVGSIYCRIYNSYSAEIFGIISLDKINRNIIERTLIEQVSIECQKRRILNVTLFSDLTRYNEMAESIGFTEVDTHITFERIL